MDSFKQYHDEIFDFLISKHKEDEKFMFLLRRTNTGQKLEKGYWFWGTENMIVLSFWKGIDWGNEVPVPNISLQLKYKNNHWEYTLAFSANDSTDIARWEILQELAKIIKVNNFNDYQNIIWKNYPNSYPNSPIEFIKRFLNREKNIIDNFFKNYPNKTSLIHPYGNNELGFWRSQEFKENLDNLKKYKNIISENKILKNLFSIQISKLEVKNFRGIDDLKLSFPKDSQWIFFTGENGFGKTCILQALTVGLEGYKKHTFDIIESKADINVSYIEQERVIQRDSPNSRQAPPLKKLVAYGASRLAITRDAPDSSPTRSLFETDSYLWSIEKEFAKWYLKSNESQYDKKQIVFFELINELLPRGVQIKVDTDKNDRIFYVEKGFESRSQHLIPFENLASGYRSIIAMIGDMLLRFYEIQPEITDPTEITGIAVIDEIDLYLHPKWQREFVKRLSTTFPKVQFIVSIHSPIPLLGAPENSVIYKVTRTESEGIKAEILDIDLSRLTPNTILTSPIFDFEDIYSENIPSNEIPMGENLYKEVLERNEIRQALRKIAKTLPSPPSLPT